MSSRAQPSQILTDFRARMQDARARGASFEAAWRAATRARTWCGGTVGWRAALEATKPAWEDAYLRRPSAVGSSLDALARALDEADDVPIGGPAEARPTVEADRQTVAA